ncbi:unnamed protein product [Meganyctiphanes norvegica]|uniref:Uncharacterized protein n=1 Tax=Meganyctiphanes norvegica TaxID=48144 RepID=A0AAV2PQT9_MEGNR
MQQLEVKPLRKEILNVFCVEPLRDEILACMMTPWPWAQPVACPSPNSPSQPGVPRMGYVFCMLETIGLQVEQVCPWYNHHTNTLTFFNHNYFILFIYDFILCM